MLMRGFAVALLVLGCCACTARASSDIVLGYSFLDLEGRDTNLSNASGAEVGVQLSAPPAPFEAPTVRMNLGLSLGYWVGHGADNDTEPDQSRLYLGKMVMGPSWKNMIGDFFIEPGVNAVLMLGQYSSDATNGDISFSQWKGGYGVEPNLKLGVVWPGMQAGLDLHYTWGKLKFSNSVGGEINEVFVGGFFGWRW
jgi:hypothetical protein